MEKIKTEKADKKLYKISAAIITLNEEDRIGRLIESLGFADEIVVVDSGSTDKTVKICKEKRAKVIYNRWPGYAEQKQFAADISKGDWILSLDADEEVSYSLAKEIKDALESVSSNVSAFSMPRMSKYIGRWIKHGGWYPDRKVRLYRKDKGVWKGKGLHEKIEITGEIKKLSGPILHYVYRNIADQVVTVNSFSSTYAQHAAPARGWIVHWGLFRAMSKFIECYILKLGILDGLPGLVIAANSAWYVFLRYAKIWEKGLKDI